MKKIFFLIASCLLSFHVIAQNSEAALWNKYCGKLQDGKIIVMSDGIELISEVTLDNGTKIKPNGTIIKKDGTKIVLKDGECVDNDGNLMESKLN